jgi:hypothetical protein
VRSIDIDVTRELPPYPVPCPTYQVRFEPLIFRWLADVIPSLALAGNSLSSSFIFIVPAANVALISISSSNNDQMQSSLDTWIVRAVTLGYGHALRSMLFSAGGAVAS